MRCRRTHHTVEVGDRGVFVGVGVEQHLGVGVDGDVGLDLLSTFAQELGHGLHLRFRLRARPAVRFITGMGGGSFLWGETNT